LAGSRQSQKRSARGQRQHQKRPLQLETPLISSTANAPLPVDTPQQAILLISGTPLD
jgi:hypothetical protein